MTVRSSYKQTEVGVIPEGWEVSKIGDLIENEFIVGHLDGNHGGLYPRSHEFKIYGVPYIGANDFQEGEVTFERCKFLSNERAAKFRKGIARDGDVLFAHNATVGPVALLRTNLPFVILSTTATYFRCNPEKLSNVYLKAALQAQHFVRQYQAVMAQSTRFQVPITAQRKLSLVIAPLPEQRAIAEALSDVDALLGGLDRLIAKKRDLKQAAMQQLLTGQTRLPGFRGEWEETNLGRIGKFKNGLNKDISAFGHGSPFVNLLDIFGVSAINSTSHLGLIASTKMDREVYDLRQGDVLFIRSSVKPSGVGLTVVVECDLYETVYSGFLIRFRDEGALDTGFKKHCFYEEEFRKKIIAASSVSANTNINQNALGAIMLLLPPTKDEQTAIAEVLTDMDTELAALEQRREKTRALKQAMMQELLTGRTRLV